MRWERAGEVELGALPVGPAGRGARFSALARRSFWVAETVAGLGGLIGTALCATLDRVGQFGSR